jgi:hypothetical protein
MYGHQSSELIMFAGMSGHLREHALPEASHAHTTFFMFEHQYYKLIIVLSVLYFKLFIN